MSRSLILFLFSVFLWGCSDARIASRNLSKAAEQFEIARKVIFMNVITGQALLEIEGRCSLDHQPGRQGTRHDQLELTCKVGESDYRKHHLGLTDNVTYFSEQLSAGEVSTASYRILIRPSVLIPDLDFQLETPESPTVNR